MEWVCPAVLALLPVILYGLRLLVNWILTADDRRPCPACGQRGLRWVNLIKATILVNGRRAPDCWVYYCCKTCGAGFKLHRGVWIRVPDEEIQKYDARSRSPRRDRRRTDNLA